MNLSDEERRWYGSDAVKISEMEDCRVFYIENETGDVVMTTYSVFPGVDLVYNDVHIEYCFTEKGNVGSLLEINHCREGRIECEFKNEFFYLSPGDMVIARKDDTEHGAYFPIKHYHGISIMIDIEKAEESLRGILDDVDISPTQIAEKFCRIENCCVMRGKPEFEHIFSELYSVPEGIKKGYFKVKILELLLFMSGMEMDGHENARYFYSRQQVALAKNVCKYLSKHMSTHITLEQLSKEFGASGTHLKNCFKGVYGTSIYAYARAQKMQLAELRLRETESTILEIAGELGYDNGSKFAKAFKSITGLTPTEYRRKAVQNTDFCVQMEPENDTME